MTLKTELAFWIGFISSTDYNSYRHFWWTEFNSFDCKPRNQVCTACWFKTLVCKMVLEIRTQSQTFQCDDSTRTSVKNYHVWRMNIGEAAIGDETIKETRTNCLILWLWAIYDKDTSTITHRRFQQINWCDRFFSTRTFQCDFGAWCA